MMMMMMMMMMLLLLLHTNSHCQGHVDQYSFVAAVDVFSPYWGPGLVSSLEAKAANWVLFVIPR